MTNKTLPELRKMPEGELTAEEKLLLHGKGNPNVVMYRKRGSQVVSRTFRPDEKIPDGWEDSPAKCGAAETAPALRHVSDDSFDEVVAAVVEQPTAPKGKGEK